MNNILENRYRLIGEVYDYVKEIVDVSINNDWKIIVWGFGRGGKFLRHLIEDVDKRLKVSFIIDENLRVSYDAIPAIFRPSLLDYIDLSKYIILSTIKHIQEIENRLKKYGYEKGKNLMDFYTDIGDSYIEFIQRKNKFIDFSSVKKIDMERDYGEEYVEHIPFGYSCVDNVFDTITALDSRLSFFDYGCGKGAAILMAYMSGVKKIGGVEIDKNIFKQLLVNMKELKIECDLFNVDATKCQIDEYNCFFLYNPFSGTIFKKVISNIQESYKNNKRKIFLVYANPFCHNLVIEDGIFKLYKQVRVDLYDPILNIYILDNK